MKKIINSKLYNTETATELGIYSNNLPESDFHFCDEFLYRKKNGEYFLYGKGGAMSKYAEIYGNTHMWGEDITPYTEDEAKEWAEKHLTADEYIEIFGEVEE